MKTPQITFNENTFIRELRFITQFDKLEFDIETKERFLHHNFSILNYIINQSDAEVILKLNHMEDEPLIEIKVESDIFSVTKLYREKNITNITNINYGK